MRPIYLATSAWLEHIPFAFWLVNGQRPKKLVELGTHYGASYFAFCQAIEKLTLGTTCYAIDTWKGDQHAGFYDEEVYAIVTAHNNALYSRFSRLVRATFDDSVTYFEDGAIDLLHIDGLHTFEAAQHDFQTWRPKLSESAIVLLHDTNVREREFGVGILFAQLSAEHPSFEFKHGHGLGVIGVGKNQPAAIQGLFEASKHGPTHRDYCEFFARLGRACADAHCVSILQKQLQSLRPPSLPPASS
ncbi:MULTISPECIES: class I SAM-dependent methyltransferase [unclassified Bradyrhizobium]|uniref:class I SAM-dependent methyltransferase n=1 Tax=unclassified Bradyrhizobium TaxID=2631580 RepID=UPI00209FF121|nr:MULTISPECIES: class I SAM-dependent methyltransferase [unclassified Bradyrhizobium]